MTAPIVGSSPSAAVGESFLVAPFGGSDGLLPLTGFGPGTLIIALIGGVMTLSGALLHKLSRRPIPAHH